jgi:hypothetical protein
MGFLEYILSWIRPYQHGMGVETWPATSDAGPIPAEINESHHISVSKLLSMIKDDVLPSHSIDNGKVVKARFIPPEVVDSYFKYNSPEPLLEAVFQNFTPERVTDGRRPIVTNELIPTYCKICCILAMLRGQLALLPRFVEQPYLCDARLPFNTKDAPCGFPRDTADNKFYEKFYELQWRFCPVFVSPRFGLRYPSEALLPFISIDDLKWGVYKVEIHPSCDGLVAAQPRSMPSANHTYVIKTASSPRDIGNYRREVNLFRRLTIAGQKQPPGIVSCYGSFEHRQTFYLLLEYAELGTLEEYISTTEKPSGEEELVGFWKATFRIVEGLRWVHEQLLPRREDWGKLVQQAFVPGRCLLLRPS